MTAEPCPFCGGAPETSPMRSGLTSVRCECSSSGIELYSDEWNRRPIEDALRCERDEARSFGEDAANRYNELITRGPVLTCAFCTKEYRAPHNTEIDLSEHIKVCSKHPIRSVELDLGEARQKIESLKLRLATIRAATIEECARTVEKLYRKNDKTLHTSLAGFDLEGTVSLIRRDAATCIRSLITPPATDTKETT